MNRQGVRLAGGLANVTVGMMHVACEMRCDQWQWQWQCWTGSGRQAGSGSGGHQSAKHGAGAAPGVMRWGLVGFVPWARACSLPSMPCLRIAIGAVADLGWAQPTLDWSNDVHVC